VLIVLGAGVEDVAREWEERGYRVELTAAPSWPSLAHSVHRRLAAELTA